MVRQAGQQRAGGGEFGVVLRTAVQRFRQAGFFYAGQGGVFRHHVIVPAFQQQPAADGITAGFQLGHGVDTAPAGHMPGCFPRGVVAVVIRPAISVRGLISRLSGAM